MAAIGQRNTLRVVHAAPPGLYLDGGEHGEILLPRRYITAGMQPEALVDVFVYLDSEDRVVATTEQPRVMVGQFACLEVVGDTPNLGAFLDWGLSKDLLLPIREQDYQASVGDWVVVYVFVDAKNGRIVATTQISPNLNLTTPAYAVGEKVHLLVFEETSLGYNAIINNAHQGLIYRSELSVPLLYGQEVDGFVKAVRHDGKVDLRLDPAGYERVPPLADQIVEALKQSGGKIDLDDDSTPDAIRDAFGTSKKAFKQAIGALYRQRRIAFERPGIRLLAEEKR